MTEENQKGSFIVRALPVMALLAWLAALLLAITRINPWTPGQDMVMYGGTVPTWFVAALLVVSLAFGVVAIWRQDLIWGYLCAAAIVPLGTGAKNLVGTGITSGDLVALLGFALAVFLIIEYLSAVPRFQAIVASTQGLAGGEARPVARFLGRYLVGSAMLGLVYAVVLGGWVQYVVPALAGLFSDRIADGIENRTALGITTFTGIVLMFMFFGRMLYDGIMSLVRDESDDEEQDDIVDIQSVNVHKEARS